MNIKLKISGKLGALGVGDDFPVRIMGVLNLTQNSFYKSSVKTSDADIVESALRMEREGADIIDIGGRSTAPYRTGEVNEETESRLVSKALRLIKGRTKIPVSVDTTRLSVARTAIEEGVRIINDPHGLVHDQGKGLAKLIGDRCCSLVLTAHETREGRSRDPMKRISKSLQFSLPLANRYGVEDVVIDPGIGFFSDSRITNVEWNCNVLANLDKLRDFRLPILVGVSRKKFLGVLGGGIPAEERLPGSLSATAIAVLNGAHVVRTHDVKETKESVLVASKIKAEREKSLS
jgi:dihydropteroate synthase